MKKILILGSTGFIGRNAAEYFAENSDLEVYGTYFKSSPLDHKNIQMIRADLTNKDDVDRVIRGKNIIIQAAAVTSGIKDVAENPHAFISDNAVMNSLILRSAFDHAVDHLILLSCTVMYQSSEIPLKETDFDANEEMYHSYFGGAWNKVYFEKMCEFYSRLGSTKFTALRHSNIYGPYDKFDLQRAHALGATVNKVMTAASDTLTVWGTGEEKRDLLYISDMVNSIDAVITNQIDPFKLYNIGLGEAVSIKHMVQKIIKISGNSLKVEHDLSKPSNKTAFCLDISKAQHELKWSPKITLEEGIGLTIKWFKNNTP